jgi:predicted permease
MLGWAKRDPARYRTPGTIHDSGGRMAAASFGSIPLRYAWRSLRRAPVFTGTVVGTLALGVGAVTATFSIMNAVLLRPLPYPESDRLVSMGHPAPGLKIGDVGQSLGTYFTYRRLGTAFDETGLHTTTSLSIADPAGGASAERVSGGTITPSVLRVLRVTPLLGRGFTDDEGRRNAAAVVLLSEELWRRRFGADRSIVGRTVQVDGRETEVVGIMPSAFDFPNYRVQAWIPLLLNEAATEAGGFDQQGIARLKPSVTIAAAQRDAERAFARFPELYPILAADLGTKSIVEQAKMHPVIRSLRDEVVGPFAEVLWIIGATAALVLLVAGANVANLLLVRAEARQKELTVRTALGAGKGRVRAHFFAESLLLGMLGGAAGIVLAQAAVTLLTRYGPADIPRLNAVTIDAAALVFGFGAALLAAFAAAIVPIVRQGTTNLASVLRDAGRGGTVGKARQRTRGVLVAVQVALAVILLSGSGLLGRSILRLRDVRPGFDAAGLLTFRIDLPGNRYRTSGDMVRLYDQLVARLQALPGVTAAGVSTKLPLVLDGSNLNPITRADRPTAPDELPPLALLIRATDSYFRAMRIPLVAGRVYGSLTATQSPFEVLINRRLAQELWGDSTGTAALGQQLAMLTGTRYTVVGVVETVRDSSLSAPSTSQVFFPIVPASDSGADRNLLDLNGVAVVLRTSGDPAQHAAAARRIVADLDPSLPVFHLNTMEHVVGESYARLSFTLLILAVAAAATLLLGAVGLYGVVAYVVGLRTREIGVRIALGAQPGAVGRGIARQGIVLALVGAAVGLLAFLLLAQSLRAFLFEVAPTDPLTLAGVVTLLVVVAAGASWLPAVRAARISPVEAMRAD